jgi:hypothetical protein
LIRRIGGGAGTGAGFTTKAAAAAAFEVTLAADPGLDLAPAPVATNAARGATGKASKGGGCAGALLTATSCMIAACYSTPI